MVRKVVNKKNGKTFNLTDKFIIGKTVFYQGKYAKSGRRGTFTSKQFHTLFRSKR